jgi:hypothetical protein
VCEGEEREKAITDKTAIRKRRERARALKRERARARARERERTRERERERLEREGERGRSFDPHPPPMHYSVHIHPQILTSLAPALSSSPLSFPHYLLHYIFLSPYTSTSNLPQAPKPPSLSIFSYHTPSKSTRRVPFSQIFAFSLFSSPFFAHLDFLRAS